MLLVKYWKFSRKLSAEIFPPHITTLNYIIYRAFLSDGFSASKEPVEDGKRSDDLTLVPFCADKPLTWDVTADRTLAGFYIDSAVQEAGAPAELAANIKSSSQYSVFLQSQFFQPITVESACVIDSSVLLLIFINALGRLI